MRNASTSAIAGSSRQDSPPQQDQPPRFLRVLKAYIQEPSQVASICPSSPVLNNRLADPQYFRQASTVVEIGPGNGETTQEILRQMPVDGKLLAIEKTDAFIGSLHELQDERLIIKHGDAIDLIDHLHGVCLGAPDVVVSGVPFSVLSPQRARQIIESIHHVLPVGGKFMAYQLRDHVARYADPKFGKPDKVEWVWRNLPPLRIYQWTKSS
jgi:phosphatidylethanolamine/phosphatidyl-N-methylethanolamine N-methyltransferase